MPTLKSVKAEVIRAAAVERSEGGSLFDRLDTILDNSLRSHNESYTWSTLPDREVELVVMLAWRDICYHRANYKAINPDKSLGSYSEGGSSGYSELMSLAKSLESRYQSASAKLGLSASSSTISVGVVTKRNAVTGAVTPMTLSSDVPAILDAAVTVESPTTQVAISWTMRTYLDFNRFSIYHLEDSDDSIIDTAAHSSATGIPYLNSAALRVYSSINQDLKTVRLTGLDRSVSNRFVVVCGSRGGRYSFSDEITLAAE